MTTAEVIIIFLLLFLSVAQLLGNGAVTKNQKYILEKIEELSKNLKL